MGMPFPQLVHTSLFIKSLARFSGPYNKITEMLSKREINHNDASETYLESAADFPDSAENRNLIDKLAAENGWEPYRTVVCLLMYHLQEQNLVLL